MSSATFPEDVQQLAGNYMSNYIFVIRGTGGVNPDISQEVKKVTKQTRLFNKVKVIVSVETKRTADFVAAAICNSDYNLQVNRYYILCNIF